MIRFLPLLCLAAPAAAEVVVATRTIPARSLIAPADLAVSDQTVPGAVTDPAQLIGMETRVALYAGRPISPGDVGFPALVERNQRVTLVYQSAALSITTEGRAMDRGAPGEAIAVMNLASRQTVMAVVGVDGALYVSP